MEHKSSRSIIGNTEMVKVLSATSIMFLNVFIKRKSNTGPTKNFSFLLLLNYTILSFQTNVAKNKEEYKDCLESEIFVDYESIFCMISFCFRYIHDSNTRTIPSFSSYYFFPALNWRTSSNHH